MVEASLLLYPGRGVVLASVDGSVWWNSFTQGPEGNLHTDGVVHNVIWDGRNCFGRVVEDFTYARRVPRDLVGIAAFACEGDEKTGLWLVEIRYAGGDIAISEPILVARDPNWRAAWRYFLLGITPMTAYLGKDMVVTADTASRSMTLLVRSPKGNEDAYLIKNSKAPFGFLTSSGSPGPILVWGDLVWKVPDPDSQVPAHEQPSFAFPRR
jgi:hypothetical protein